MPPDARRPSSLGSSIGWRGSADAPAASHPHRPKRGRWGLRLLLALGWLALLSAAFALGYLLAEYDAQHLLARVQALQTERDMLTEQVAAEAEARLRLERSHQIDVQAQRSAQEQLNALGQDRMQLEQDLAQLRSLVEAGGRGIVELSDLTVASLQKGVYEYSLSLDQLVPDLGTTKGEVVVSLVGRRDGELVEESLSALSDGAAGSQAFAFEHTGQVVGRFELPPDLEPLKLVVEILPKGDTFIPSKRSAAWAEAIDGSARVESGYPESERIDDPVR